MKQRRQFKVLIVTSIAAGASARNTLSGIFRFINSGHNWSIRIISDPVDFTPKDVSAAKAEGYDGMIITIDGIPHTDEAIVASDIPVAFLDTYNKLYKKRKHDIVFVSNDNSKIVSAAFQHLSYLGKFRHFGFVPAIEGKQPWSTAREMAFRKKARQSKTPYCVFSGGNPDDSALDQRNLVDWLKALPKPAAVMTAWDFRATQVIDACNEAAINIPEQIAVIGVDNDVLFCNSTIPRLTSVQPDMEKSGFTAAQELNRIMSSRRRFSPKSIHTIPKCVVVRESTRSIPPAEKILSRAIEFINSNFDHINVDSVSQYVGVSRRLLERRFHEFSNLSIAQTILACRLKKAKHLLRKTNYPMSAIASQCGFKSASSLSHIFKREIGMPLVTWRQRI